jgi:hypothetical protein
MDFDVYPNSLRNALGDHKRCPYAINLRDTHSPRFLFDMPATLVYN